MVAAGIWISGKAVFQIALPRRIYQDARFARGTDECIRPHKSSNFGGVPRVNLPIRRGIFYA